MTNSAHDKIEIFSDNEDLSNYKEQLDRAKIGPDKLYDVLTLIQRMSKAELLGEAELTNCTLKLKFNGSDQLYLKFDICYLKKLGWLKEFPKQVPPCLNVEAELLEDYKDALTSEDELLESYKGSKLKFTKRSENAIQAKLPKNITVDQLLRQMDLYGVGRPSTFASTFKAMRENGFITVDETTFEIRMTKAAFRTYCLLKEKLPELYRADFSTWLYILQRDLEQNDKAISDILSSVCKRVLPSEQAGKAISNLWESIDDFYPEVTKSDTEQSNQMPQISYPKDKMTDSDKVASAALASKS
jgi:DNA topoisomerase IA